MTSLSPTEQISAELLARYGELIYRQTGIRISDQKRTLLSNRLRRRLRETGIATFDDYYRKLQRLSAHDPEWDAFLQEITTHETYLFRDMAQWDWLRTVFLPELSSRNRATSSRSLRIWSAACSTGDEPVTIACCVAAALPNYSQWKVDILGTDIGIGALEEARAAEFDQRAMRQVPPDYLKRYFQEQRPGQWQARGMLTSMLRYRQHNLLERMVEPLFDVVFLKNVLIYFDTDSKRRVLEHIRSALQPGGLLVAGGSEGVSELLRDFDRLHPWLYRRQESGGGRA